MSKYSYNKGTFFFFFTHLDCLCMELVIQHKKAHFCFSCAAIVLKPLIKTYMRFGNIQILVNTALASPKTTEILWKLLTFSPLGPLVAQALPGILEVINQTSNWLIREMSASKESPKAACYSDTR